MYSEIRRKFHPTLSGHPTFWVATLLKSLPIRSQLTTSKSSNLIGAVHLRIQWAYSLLKYPAQASPATGLNQPRFHAPTNLFYAQVYIAPYRSSGLQFLPLNRRKRTKKEVHSREIESIRLSIIGRLSSSSRSSVPFAYIFIACTHNFCLFIIARRRKPQTGEREECKKWIPVSCTHATVAAKQLTQNAVIPTYTRKLFLA